MTPLRLAVIAIVFHVIVFAAWMASQCSCKGCEDTANSTINRP